ncbi:transposase (plasmid) [Azospirillum argentinense]|uniref:Transposase n=1 Tax=Azospirillum brasilense TaxID=192 RepID=A0A4D8QC77_AZOBR|nr:transposase [Azospirillum argentinense]QCO03712.1 transposase [Azospirillum argentinense]
MLEVRTWEAELDVWLEPFLDALGHKARRRWAPVYIRGLYGRTERKSVQPIAAEVTPGDYDQLHNFIASRSWDTAPLGAILVQTADQLVGGPDAILAIDDTAMLKKGEHSVGVAPQYAGVVGTRHDGTWKGTYHPVQALGAKCNTSTTNRTMVVKDGVATMTSTGKSGAARIYTGTVRGDTLDMASDDGIVYSGTFTGNHYAATTGRDQCTNGVDLDRVDDTTGR